LSTRFPVPIAGDRLNASGSRLFKRLLLSRDAAGIVALAREQIDSGAAWLDVCTALDDGSEAERERMAWVVSLLTRELRVPVLVDSADPAVLTSATGHGPGTVLNSISLKHGAPGAAPVLDAARDHGLAVVALTIDRQGLASTVERRLAVAAALLELASSRGFPASSLWCDPLVLPVASQPAAARATIEAIEALKHAWPALRLVVGISDISFGLPPSARAVVDQAFLHRCAVAGLDVAIANPVRLAQPTVRHDERLADALVMDGDPRALEELRERHRPAGGG
jgi:5-methyltetrahydrofolate--homocysteine methyltransferase